MKTVSLKPLLIAITALLHSCVTPTLYANPIQDFAKLTDGQYWTRYQVAMEAGNTSCCSDSYWDNNHWDSGHRSNNKWANCTLGGASMTTTFNANPTLADNDLQIFVKVDNHQVTDLRSFSTACIVNTDNQTVYPLDDVSSDESISFLNTLIEADTYNSMAKSALVAMALHKGNEAQAQLERLASDSGAGKSGEERQEDAIFWLGKARNAAGFNFLKTLLQQKTATELRKRIVFSISVSETANALDHLVTVATKDSDPEIRVDALFWLTNNQYPNIENLILDAINNDPNREVNSKAVFSLSRVKTETAFQHLIDLSHSHANKEVQEKAIFWLAKSGDNRAKTVLVDMLHGEYSYQIKEKVIFGLSQLQSPQSTKSLVYVVKNIKDGRLVKKALFWLNQSDDPQALTFIDSLFSI